jgi:5'-phosphate synthase pdxT subunit
VSTAAEPRVGPAEPRPRVGVLALQGDVREHVRALTDAGAEPVPVRRAGELADLDGLVLPGGESTTMGRLAVRFGLLDPLREAVAGGLPTYGSCAGMVLLADRLLDGVPGQQLVGGLDVTVRRNAFGRQVDSSESDLAMAGVQGGPVHAVLIRAPWVEEVGEGVEVLARVESGPGAGRVVAVRQGHLLATAFHPEITADSRVHRLFVEGLRDSARACGARPQEREEQS